MTKNKYNYKHCSSILPHTVWAVYPDQSLRRCWSLSQRLYGMDRSTVHHRTCSCLIRKKELAQSLESLKNEAEWVKWSGLEKINKAVFVSAQSITEKLGPGEPASSPDNHVTFHLKKVSGAGGQTDHYFVFQFHSAVRRAAQSLLHSVLILDGKKASLTSKRLIYILQNPTS